MRAVVIHGEKDIRLEDIPMPEPKEDELLMKVASVCVCGSDLHYYMEGGVNTKRIVNPQVPGHEAAAWVWDDRAPEFGLKKGQLVAIEPAESCGNCEPCHAGWPNMCLNQRFHGGPPHQGALAEYFKANRHMIVEVPEEFTPAQAAGLEQVGICVHALRKADLQVGQSVAVLGAGPIGLLLMQLARAQGCGNLIVVEPVDYRREAALKLGADHAVASFEDVVALNGDEGIELVLEATTDPSAFDQAVRIVKWAGRVVLVGIPTGVNYNPIDALTMRTKEVTVCSCKMMGDVFPEAIEAVKRGMVDVDALFTHHVELDQAIDAYKIQAEHKDGCIKSVVYPNGVLK
jgi:L-iditol 2-dehydrogenase